MPKHGFSVALRPQKPKGSLGREPRTSTSTFTQLLNSAAQHCISLSLCPNFKRRKTVPFRSFRAVSVLLVLFAFIIFHVLFPYGIYTTILPCLRHCCCCCCCFYIINLSSTARAIISQRKVCFEFQHTILFVPVASRIMHIFKTTNRGKDSLPLPFLKSPISFPNESLNTEQKEIITAQKTSREHNIDRNRTL